MLLMPTSPRSRSRTAPATRSLGFTGTSAFPDKLEPTQMTRYEMADYALKSKAMGVNFIGACCGTVAIHVREMAKVLGKHEEEQIWQPDPDKPMSETEFNWGTGARRAKRPAIERGSL